MHTLIGKPCTFTVPALGAGVDVDGTVTGVGGVLLRVTADGRDYYRHRSDVTFHQEVIG
jgi:hypothetical protein